jgi:uncharacterized protein involved in outer membrane biogenesis
MRRILLIILLAVVVLVAGIAGIGWYLLHDEDFLKARLNAYMLGKTGRELVIVGPLNLELGRRAIVRATDLRLQNAAWADEPWLARVGQLHVMIDLASLFSETVVLEQLYLDDCAVHLQEKADGAANWDALAAFRGEAMPVRAERVGLPVALLDKRIRGCRLTLDAPDRDKPLELEVEEFVLRLENHVRWLADGRGRLNGEPLALSGWLEPAGELLRGGAIEHDLELNAGEVRLTSAGTVRDTRTGAGANVQLSFQGPEFATVLQYLGAPAFADGAFDLAVRLDSSAPMTQLDVDGDLGSLQISAQGELDQLVQPTRGTVASHIEGPDLAAFAAALGVDGLVAEPFVLRSDAEFAPGMIHFTDFRITTPGNSLSLQGLLGTGENLVGTELVVEAQSEELAPWLQRLERPPAAVGPVALQGRLIVADDGLASVDAKLSHEHNELAINGSLGRSGEAMQPDLNVDYHSDDPVVLAAILPKLPIPRTPVSLRGRLSLLQGQLQLERVDLAVAAHRARLDGRINPRSPYHGSRLDVRLESPNAAAMGRLFGYERLPAAPLAGVGQLDYGAEGLGLGDTQLDLGPHRLWLDGRMKPGNKLIGSAFSARLETPDLDDLARLFGREGWPAEALALEAEWRAEGRGLVFKTRHGALGAARLAIDGRIADLQQPLLLDADFDIALPSLSLLDFLLDQGKLPDLPFAARGALRREQNSTRLDEVQAELGPVRGTVAGQLQSDRRFDLALELAGEDASALQRWSRRLLPSEPYSLQLRARGAPEDFELQGIEARLGASTVAGGLRVEDGERRRVSGRLESPYLDLRHWYGAGERKSAATKVESPYMFDDTPVMSIDDYGIDFELEISVARLDLGNTFLQQILFDYSLRDSRLELDLISLRGQGGGDFSGHLVLDAINTQPHLALELSGQKMRLGLMAKESQDQETFPESDLAIVLDGTGTTRREMASGLNGSVRIKIGTGQIAKSGVDILFNDFLTELFTQLNPQSEKSEYTRIDCAVMAADVTAGVVDVVPAVFHLEPLTIFSRGTVDLRSERIDLAFNSKPRKGLGITAGTVINPFIKVGGTLKKPALELDPAGAVIGGGAAVATAGLSVVAKSFADRFLASKDPCGDALKEIAEHEP